MASNSIIGLVLDAMKVGFDTLTTSLPGKAHIGAQSGNQTLKPYAVLIPQTIAGTRSDAINNFDIDTLVTVRVYGDSIDSCAFAMQQVMTYFEDPTNFATLPSPEVQEMQVLDGAWPLASAAGAFGDVNFKFLLRGSY